MMNTQRTIGRVGESVIWVCLVLFVLVSPAAAQTVERTIDLSSLGWGLVIPHMVETDGNPSTEEWVVEGTSFSGAGKWRVIAVRNGGLCIGEWFNPQNPQAYGTVQLTKGNDGRSRLIVTETVFHSWGPEGPRSQHVARVVLLDTPACQ